MTSEGRICFLSGNGLDLVPVDTNLLDAYSRRINDPSYRAYMRGMFPLNRKGTESFISHFIGQDQADSNVFLGISIQGEADCIGHAELLGISWIDGMAWLGLGLFEKAERGKGIAGRAIDLLLDYGFGALNLQKVHAGIYGPNESSLSAAKKAGFEEAGSLREALLLAGEMLDCHVLELSRENWLERKR